MVPFQSHEAHCIYKPALPNPTHRKMEGQPYQRMAEHTQLSEAHKNYHAVAIDINNHKISEKMIKYLQHPICIITETQSS